MDTDPFPHFCITRARISHLRSQEQRCGIPPSYAKTIVKVMKSHKKIDHNRLIKECIKILSSKFVPDPQLIKRRIEGLIERDYMDRDKEDRTIYNYIA